MGEKGRHGCSDFALRMLLHKLAHVPPVPLCTSYIRIKISGDTHQVSNFRTCAAVTKQGFVRKYLRPFLCRSSVQLPTTRWTLRFRRRLAHCGAGCSEFSNFSSNVRLEVWWTVARNPTNIKPCQSCCGSSCSLNSRTSNRTSAFPISAVAIMTNNATITNGTKRPAESTPATDPVAKKAATLESKSTVAKAKPDANVFEIHLVERFGIPASQACSLRFCYSNPCHPYICLQIYDLLLDGKRLSDVIGFEIAVGKELNKEYICPLGGSKNLALVPNKLIGSYLLHFIGCP